MKIFKILAIVSLMYPAVSFAATYPATCPVEAQAIVNSVGGCAAISCTKYAAICAKCGCSSSASSQSQSSQTVSQSAKNAQGPASNTVPASTPEQGALYGATAMLVFFVLWFIIAKIYLRIKNGRKK